MKALAVLRNGKERVPSLPDVPTTAEAGLDDCEVSVWYGILAPAKTPREIVNKLNGEWNKIVAMPDTLEMMEKVGVEPLSGTSEQFSKLLKSEIVLWEKIVKEANLGIK